MDLYEKLVDLKQAGISAMLVTVIDKNGEGPVEVGKKMLVTGEDQAFGTVGGGALEHAARELAKAYLITHTSTTKRYLLAEGKVLEDSETLPMACGGSCTLFFDYVGAKGHVYVFGAGHVGQALVNVLQTMPYFITIIDDRKEVVAAFKGGNQVHCMSFTEYIEKNRLQEGSYVIVCTPSHKEDYHVLHTLLKLNLRPKYFGMLCSKTKLRDYLSKTYEVFGDKIDLSHFYSPIGLDIGGGSPEEIAISIASEMLAVEYDKKGHLHMRGEYK